MLSKRTVLVLGAGASKPYFFPVGRELLRRVVRGLRKPSTILSRQLQVCGHKKNEAESFSHALVRAQQPSVDAFLERRPEFLEIGKLAIASELILVEQENYLLPTFTDFEGHEGRWYDYLFGMMGASVEEFETNNLSVVTFNYDRSFEHALFLFLKHNNKLDDEAAEQLRSKVPVIHVHGELGGRRYKPAIPAAGEPMDGAVVYQSAGSIRVVHESVQDDPEFAEARRLLQQAEVVCILGFAYHRQNVERLRLHQLDPRLTLFGTALSLGTAEKNRAERVVKRRITLYGSLDALQFLREVNAFS